MSFVILGEISKMTEMNEVSETSEINMKRD